MAGRETQEEIHSITETQEEKEVMAKRETQEEIHNICETQTQKEVEERKRSLYEAAKNGDWKTAEEIFKKFPEARTERLNSEGETPLHVAIAAMQDNFVTQLVFKISKEDIEIRTQSGKAAIHYAAEKGHLHGVRMLGDKKCYFYKIRDEEERLPICIAALNGHREIVIFIGRCTFSEMENGDKLDLLINLIEGKIFDIANSISSSKMLTQVKTLEQCKILLPWFLRSGSKIDFDLIMNFPWNLKDICNIESDSDAGQAMFEIMCIAIEEGEVEFLRKLADSFPEAFSKVIKNDHTIFHVAVMSRFEKIFDVIQNVDADRLELIKKEINEHDVNGNKLLHLAGYLPSTPKFGKIENQEGNPEKSFDGYLPLLNPLNDIPGAALQLQYELIWFEELKKFVYPQLINAKNKDKLSPRDVFLKEHENLRKAGEEWMRNTAHSCMLVATLIATVVFAAAFTVPGGNKQDRIPNFLGHPAFKVFVISDALSLVCSISTVLSFLSILTSRYSVEDFRYSLPTKLLLGLLFLSISVVAMMLAFVAAFFIVVKHGQLKFAYPIAAIASLPIILFIWQHARLFYQIIQSTYFAPLASIIKTEKPSIWTQIKKIVNKIRFEMREQDMWTEMV